MSLSSVCPMCGHKFNVVRVEADYYGIRCWKVVGYNEHGEVCCSWDDYTYETQEQAQIAAKKISYPKHIQQFRYEKEDEARSYDH